MYSSIVWQKIKPIIKSKMPNLCSNTKNDNPKKNGINEKINISLFSLLLVEILLCNLLSPMPQ